jgi:hypothetical protein
MRVEHDEKVDGAVAAVLVIVARKLARLGWDGLTHLADELDGGLVEADHRPLGIGGFGVEIEHIFHAGNVFAVDLGNAPHVPAPRLDAVLGQPAAHRLARQAFVVGELDHGVGQQCQGPSGPAGRWFGACGCHQQGFFLAGQLALRARTRLLAQRPFEIALHEAALGPIDRRAAHRHGTSNLLIPAAGIGGEQNLGALELARGMRAAAEHRAQFIALGLAQFDPITYIHLGLLVGGLDESIDESKFRRGALHREARPVPRLHLCIFTYV